MAGKVLIVAQNPAAASYHEAIGRLPRLLREHSHEPVWVCPRAGEPLPQRVCDFSGVWIEGAPISANSAEGIDWLRPQLELARECLRANVPLVGVCMGAGLLARALGARVSRHPSGIGERGYRLIEPTERGHDLFPPELRAFFWHQEGFELPVGSELLAASELFVQAFCYQDRHYGFQFHPESTPAIFRRWMLSADDSQLNFAGADAPERQQADGKLYDESVERWLSTFLDRWPERQ